MGRRGSASPLWVRELCQQKIVCDLTVNPVENIFVHRHRRKKRRSDGEKVRAKADWREAPPEVNLDMAEVATNLAEMSLG